jgi:diaminopimelate decarboxylase
VAYSIKTDPDEWLLKIAFEQGMLAEATSQYEVDRAVSSGFTPRDIVLNSPGKWWPSRHYNCTAFRTIFADSIDELGKYRALALARIGMRLRLPSVESRFGIALDTYDSFQSLVSLLNQYAPDCSIGLHFHLPSNVLGVQRWWHMYDSFLDWAKAIENTTGRRVDCVDIGGGWFPDDADRELRPKLEQGLAKAREALPHLREFILEPGKALTQSAMALAVQVLEVRFLGPKEKDVVVDGAISDLPMASSCPHRVLVKSASGKWQSLAKGKGRIFGRSCMENDVLSEGIEIPYGAKPGDTLVICDAGAYDRSMSYEFAMG